MARSTAAADLLSSPRPDRPADHPSPNQAYPPGCIGSACSEPCRHVSASGALKGTRAQRARKAGPFPVSGHATRHQVFRPVNPPLLSPLPVQGAFHFAVQDESTKPATLTAGAKRDGWLCLAARAPPEVQPRRTGQTRHGTGGANCASARKRDGWMAFPRRRPCRTLLFFHGEVGGERQAARQGRRAEGGRRDGRQPHTPGWLVGCRGTAAAFLAFFFCRNSTAAPPLPPFRALTKHTKRDRKSRPRQESYLQLPCPACLNAFAFRFPLHASPDTRQATR